MSREEIQIRISELQVMRWRLSTFPGYSDPLVTPAAIDLINSEISELLLLLDSQVFRKTA
ncbi:hypothetical protein [Cohnella abietis]|uniref:Uncharacterized protein n=1 Tax=Cohnella abietis TaxID=2507935 RepID=A0A3T1D1Q0_9BACL|nr:hypothetical protein [Cohnella abietis]BBI32014.1 hypothetical protein KCTCHS21_14130 [Cohnella abietis]